MRKINYIAITIFLIMVFSIPAWANSTNQATFMIGQRMYIVDGHEYYMDAVPFTENGRTFVPVRYMAVSLGISEKDISWNSHTKEVGLILNNNYVKMQIGNNNLYVNDNIQYMDVAPMIRDGRTYLPARYLAEAFGYTVIWDELKRSVIIKSPEYTIQDNIPSPDIEQYIPQGATSEIQHISLTGQSPGEIVAVYYKNDPECFVKSGVIVEKYNPYTHSWNVVFEKQYEGYRLQIIDCGKLLGDEREQIAIGTWEGSGAFLYFFLLSSVNGQVNVLLDKMDEGYFQGGLKIKNGDLYVRAASQGTRFHWNGSYFEHSSYIYNPDMDMDNVTDDIIIHYSIDQNDNMTATYSNGSTLSLTIGQSIYLIRDNKGVTERILFSGDILESQSDGGIKAVKPGNGEINIIPSGYNWDKAINYFINVE